MRNKIENEEIMADPMDRTSPEVLDLLPTSVVAASFAERVLALKLSSRLEEKILGHERRTAENALSQPNGCLSPDDEAELATEVLRCRHLFTEKLLASAAFRQAALTVVQNIYLFRNRRIFFGSTAESVERDRQEALLLFSGGPGRDSLPLAKSFQHLIIARVWRRIISRTAPGTEENDPHFKALHDVVVTLNTLRNIYMLFSAGIVRKLARKINTVYRDTITYDDAVQIGQIGIARAAYRYHGSCGYRFSTFAASWVFREIQRQALEGRLIRLSTHTVEGYGKAVKENNDEEHEKFSKIIENSSPLEWDAHEGVESRLPPAPASAFASPSQTLEEKELRDILLRAVDQVLPGRNGEIVKRRYGLGIYRGKEQSVISIGKLYGVTRSSIYQIEQTALKKLRKRIAQLYQGSSSAGAFDSGYAETRVEPCVRP